MNTKSSTRGKILLHGLGAGGIARGDVEQRARENAEINGHGDVVTESDRDEARAELNGGALPDTTADDAEGTVGLLRDPSEPPSVPGHHTPNRDDPDEQQAVERLVVEGAEEAQHDQMLAARRRQRRQEKS